ncbi:MAG: hypothetical protein U0637_00750 [Phycisphaerales bacterium]
MADYPSQGSTPQHAPDDPREQDADAAVAPTPGRHTEPPPGLPEELAHAQARTTLSPHEQAQRQRDLLLKIVRGVFAVLVTTFTALAIYNALSTSTDGEGAALGLPTSTWVVGATALLMVATVLAIDKLTRYKKMSTIAGTMLGALAGLLATLALGGLLDLLLQSWLPEKSAFDAVRPIVFSVKLIMGICLTYLGVITVLQTQDDFRLVIPYVEFAKQLRGVRPVLVDTSALVDGRIADIAATNFVQSPLVVPRFVVQELQTLADSADALKRSKGRRGLDVITRLQRLGTVDVSIDDTYVAGKAVDQMLVELARSTQAMVLTSDVGLARVASINSVTVLNLNDLSNATRLSLVPGEALTLRLMKPGEQRGQGVGYLPDGTMVVAEDGGNRIGETVTMTVTSSLQTSAGRLIFARIGDAPAGEAAPENPEPASSVPAVPETEPRAPRSPFPPKPPASIRQGTPRNPRR